MIKDWWRVVAKEGYCFIYFDKYKQCFDHTTSYRAMTIFELELLYELHFKRCSVEQATASIQIEMMFENYIA